MRHPIPPLHVFPILGGLFVCLLLLAGCGSRLPLTGPLVLDTLAVEVMFDTPVEFPGGDRVLGFTFDRPGDSRFAGGIAVVLLDAEGGEHPMQPALDRTGEASVSLRDTEPQAARYTGARLRAAERTPVQGLEWRGAGGR